MLYRDVGRSKGLRLPDNGHRNANEECKNAAALATAPTQKPPRISSHAPPPSQRIQLYPLFRSPSHRHLLLLSSLFVGRRSEVTVLSPNPPSIGWDRSGAPRPPLFIQTENLQTRGSISRYSVLLLHIFIRDRPGSRSTRWPTLNSPFERNGLKRHCKLFYFQPFETLSLF